MSPSKPNDSKPRSGRELKRFFAKRVIDQVRHLMELWRLANEESWSYQRLLELKQTNEKLIRYANRFEEHSHAELAEQIDQLLDHKGLRSGSLSSEKLEKLSEYLQLLSQAALRRSDLKQNEMSQLITPKKPIYILLNDRDVALKLTRQLQFFGFRAVTFQTQSEFLNNMQKRHPTIIVANVHFGGHLSGLSLIGSIQQEDPIPVIFYSPDLDDLETRLTAARYGGLHFHSKQFEMSLVIEEIEAITNLIPPEPYRVLVVEDSKSQSYCIENMLNTAGIITKAVNNPLLLLEHLESFQPEIILMDMYMPGCDGTELAKVIRQEQKYVRLPIVFLSSEEDLNIQLNAMSEGGDDFLTKPIKPAHLRTTIRAKAQRTRALVSLMIRDSLTGLLNHTSILSALEQEIVKARKNGTSMCFVMVDIDHFKNINDSYGHPVGDKVIKSLSLFLKQRLRKSDATGRYGGEEFAVVMNNTELDDCVRIFEDIRVRFSQFTHTTENTEFNATFSCGIALLNNNNTDTLTIEADEALYEAKRNGRNQICVHTNKKDPTAPKAVTKH